ncbi:MAG: hypothetical protein H6560_06030 [Lewinellaceae bacterium]|nr:hypothetical protein [Lewinellaceae bacterium]
MVEKNTIIFQDTFSDGYLHAIQHANEVGLVGHSAQSGEQLLSQIVVGQRHYLHYVEKQCIGNVWDYRDWVKYQPFFSPDGTKYIRFNAYNGTSEHL